MSIKSKAWQALRRALGKVKRAPGKVLDRIENVGRIRQEKDRRMQEELDVRMRPREKDPNYITVPPSRRHDVMSAGRRIIK